MFKTLVLTLAAGITMATLGCATAPTSKPAPVPTSPATAPAPAPPREVPASALVDRLGDSIQTAVTVPIDVLNEGVDFQNNWIYDHFGRFRRQKFAMGHAPGSSGHERHYDIITFELPDGSSHTVYFDMTDYWEHVAKNPKP